MFQTDFIDLPRGATMAGTGDICQGGGGRWVPMAFEIAAGRYLAAVAHLSPGARAVCIPEPVWIDRGIALRLAERVAVIAAG